MKLLLDQNLSRRLLPDLVQSFPGSIQVQHAGLERVGDADIWAYAKQHGFAIVTKDADFAELALLRGYPHQSDLAQLRQCEQCDRAPKAAG